MHSSVMNRASAALLVLLFGVILSGCATSRSQVSVAAPTPVSKPSPMSGGAASGGGSAAGQRAYIRSVTDARVFSDKPSDPSEPSLGSGGASNNSADVKARAFGRKRGGFGMAFGDVLLEPGQSVAGLVRSNTESALQSLGYTVVAKPEPGALIVDVKINKFWTWFTPGFWSVTLAGKGQVDLALSGAVPGSQRLVVAAWEDSMQVVVDSDWVKAMQGLLADYQAKSAEQLRGLPAGKP